VAYYLPYSRLLVRNTNSGGGIDITLRKIIELLNTNNSGIKKAGAHAPAPDIVLVLYRLFE
jgi:hypothetical protein